MKDGSFSVTRSAAPDIIRCNDVTSRFGIRLKTGDAQAMTEAGAKALARTGRIEFSGGTIEKLVFAFCDSPYLDAESFTAAMEEIIDIFYEFKNDSLDEVDDDEAIALMKRYFDRECTGSVDLLRDDMGVLARRIRFGQTDLEVEAEGDEGDIYDE